MSDVKLPAWVKKKFKEDFPCGVGSAREVAEWLYAELLKSAPEFDEEAYWAWERKQVGALPIDRARWQHEQMAGRIAGSEMALHGAREANVILDQENARLRAEVDRLTRPADLKDVNEVKRLAISWGVLAEVTQERDEARAEIERLKELADESGASRFFEYWMDASNEAKNAVLEKQKAQDLLAAEELRVKNYAAALTCAKNAIGNFYTMKPRSTLEEIDRLMRGEGGKG